jgi:hypothetical protein
VINVGQAAHITAASPGGARFDPALTPTQRASADNGLWLCQNCGKLIDSDDEHFTVETLRGWKRQARELAFVEVSTGKLQLPADVPDARADAIWDAAEADIEKFKGQPSYPSHPINLSLSIKGKERSELVSAAGLAAALTIQPEMSIASEPGTGKSTTLVQIANVLVASRACVPLLIPLKDWAVDRSKDFLSVVAARDSFRSVTVERLKELASKGQLAILLDGWNELRVEARDSALGQLNRLRREYPNLRLVGTTRQEATDAPFGGPRVEVRRFLMLSNLSSSGRSSGRPLGPPLRGV